MVRNMLINSVLLESTKFFIHLIRNDQSRKAVDLAKDLIGKNEVCS